MSFFSFPVALALVDDAIHFSTADPGTLLILPAYVAMATGMNRVLSVGEEARAMVGQTPANISIERVLVEGMPADHDITEAFLRHGLLKIHAKKLFRPRPIVVAAVRGCSTPAARKALMKSVLRSGAREIHLIEVGMATAIGMGLPVQEPELQAVLTVSNDWFEFTVISLSGVVVAAGGAIGSETFLEDIRNHLVLTREFHPEPSRLRALLWSRGIDATGALESTGWEVWSGRSELGRLVSEELSGQDLAIGLTPSLVRMTERIKEAIRRLTPEQQAQLARSTIHATGSALEIPGLAGAIQRLLGLSVTPFHATSHPAIAGARAALAEVRFLRQIATADSKRRES